jgi:hypothetical protein
MSVNSIYAKWVQSDPNEIKRRARSLAIRKINESKGRPLPFIK